MRVDLVQRFRVVRAPSNPGIILSIGTDSSQEVHYGFPLGVVPLLLEQCSRAAGLVPPAGTVNESQPATISPQVTVDQAQKRVAVSLSSKEDGHSAALSLEEAEKLAWDLGQAIALLRAPPDLA
jgi:hypothetical protein